MVTENKLLLPTCPTQKLNQVKCQIVLFFKIFCCHFLLYILFFFSLFIEFHSFLFLSFVIYLIKDFSINDSDLLGLQIFILNINNLLPFSLVHIIFFSLLNELYYFIFLKFAISLLKDFNINDSDLLKLEIYILNIKSK